MVSRTKRPLRGPGYGRVDSAAVVGGKTILVVDDAPAIRLLCRVNLELEGRTVLEAATLAEARAVLDACEVDAILLDAHVAGEHGGDLLRELRDREIATPVAFLTGDSFLGEYERSRAHAILPKPFELDQLSATVAHLLATPDPTLA
jgi:DNA-binding NtrC family response regulator